MEDQNLNDYSVDYLIANKYGMAISFLRAYKDNIFVPEYSYHLHFFLSYDCETDSLIIVCLDKRMFTFIEGYSKIVDKENRYKELDKKIIELSRDFIDQVWQNMKIGDIKEEYLFSRQDQELWDVFNSMKQNSFINAMNKLKRQNEENFKQIKKSRPFTMESITYKVGVEDRNVCEKEGVA